MGVDHQIRLHRRRIPPPIIFLNLKNLHATTHTVEISFEMCALNRLQRPRKCHQTTISADARFSVTITGVNRYLLIQFQLWKVIIIQNLRIPYSLLWLLILISSITYVFNTAFIFFGMILLGEPIDILNKHLITL